MRSGGDDMARQRNNVSRLPQSVRAVIAAALDEGQTYDAIRALPEVAAACAERGLALHNNSFLAYSQSAEYDEYRRCVRRYAEELERRRVAAYMVNAGRGADAMADVATYELLRIVQAKLDAGDDLDARELSAVSGALAAYQRNRIAQDKDAAARRLEAANAELEERINRLSADYESQLTALRAKLAAGGDRTLSDDALSEIEHRMGLL
ncbi:MAG: DUF3486 family protein [Victivallaceae bacterium]|nr:DUF3486 family protein [Victivallaceae bacterium]